MTRECTHENSSKETKEKSSPMIAARNIFSILVALVLASAAFLPTADALLFQVPAKVSDSVESVSRASDAMLAYAVEPGRVEGEGNKSATDSSEGSSTSDGDEKPEWYGDKNPYYDYVAIDASKIFSSDSEEGKDNPIMVGFINIIEFLVTTLLLPLAIIFCMWRTCYLAIFPMLAHWDPLDMIHNNRYSNKTAYTGSPLAGNMDTKDVALGGMGHAILNKLGSGMGNGANASHTSLQSDYFTGAYFGARDIKNMSQLAQACLKVELKFAVFGLVITFIVWGLIELMMKAAIIILQEADTVSTVISQ